MTDRLSMGIDVGTQGARVVIVDARGVLVAEGSRAFDRAMLPGLPEGHVEQDPEEWWRAVTASIAGALAELRAAERSPDAIVALAVDSTSGTIVLLDEFSEPVRPAVMYSDRRAQPCVDEVNDVATDLCERTGYRFNASFALPRLVWLMRDEPQAWFRTRRVVHAADYVVGRLTGRFDATDPTNALKTGFDTVEMRWPQGVMARLGIDPRMLPQVVPSGDAVATVSAACADATGLSRSTLVVAGMTDACADQLSSGARGVGDWNSVLGTTLVLKGLSRNILRDPEGRVYCHRHPMGWWMPGGASNVGARALDARFEGQDRAALEQQAPHCTPTALTVYPLHGAGERFPFICPEARAFELGSSDATPAQLYAAYMEGVAYVERMAYEVVGSLGADVGPIVFATGGGARSHLWTQIRADTLGRSIARCDGAGAARGAAILAASRTLFGDLSEASEQMAGSTNVTEPRADLRGRYDEGYDRFVEELRRRGWIGPPTSSAARNIPME